MTFRRSALLAFLSGCAAALGHAPFGLWLLALVGFFLLNWLVTRPNSRPGWEGWFGGLGYFGVSMHWIVEPFLVDIATHGWLAPFALILLAGGLSLFWMLAALASRWITNGPRSQAFAFALFLTAAELTRGHIFTGFPWALPAYIWANAGLIGTTAWTGSYGLSFLTVLGAGLPLMFSRASTGVIAAGALFAVLYVPAFMNAMDFHSNREELGKVRLVQPNVPQLEKWDPNKVPTHLDRLLELTRSNPDPELDMVVWPEVAVVYPLHVAGEVLATGQKAATEGSSSEVRLITGINRRDGDGNWFNAMVVLGPRATLEDTYDKVHLVPFGEYIPFKINFLRALAASSGFGFTSGNQVRLIDTPLGRALPLICYEGIFPGHLFGAGERPKYLLQITNDAWFGTFSGPYQHLDQARFRAAEQGLSMVRVANTGVSTVIDPLGQVSDSLALGEAGALDQAVFKGLAPTVYATTGDLPLVIILFLSTTGLMVVKRRNTIANRRTTS